MSPNADQHERPPVDIKAGPQPADPPPSPVPPVAGSMTWLAASLLIIGVLGRCVITATSVVDWRGGFAAASLADGFGPTAAMWLNWLMGLTLGLVFIDRLIQRQRIRWWSVGLWSVGLVVWLNHAIGSDAALRIGGDWIAATAAGLAALHLAEYPGARRVMLASIIALAAPLSVQAITQVTYTHAATIANYEQNRQQVLRQRGWIDNPQAIAKYERRLYQAEASGRFGLSNVFGSVMAALCLLIGSVAAWSWWSTRRVRHRNRNSDRSDDDGKASGAGPWPERFIWSGMLVISLVSLVLSFSKGAVGALVVTVLVMAVAGTIAWLLGWARKWWIAAGLMIVALGMVAIVLRGAAGPPDSADGERSLLFRWFYLQASVRMTAEQPLLGVGPGHFKGFYIIHKNPLSPEEVSDPHNIFAAWISTLGLGGLAWSIMLIGWLCGAAPPGKPSDTCADAASGRDSPDRPAPGGSGSAARWWSLLAAGAAVFGVQYAMDNSVLGPLALAMLAPVAVVLIVAAFWRKAGGLGVAMGLLGLLLIAITILIPFVGFTLIGAAGWFALAVALLRRTDRPADNDLSDHRPLMIGAFGASVALVLHSQIEMTLTNTMAGPLGLMIIGLAAGWSGQSRRWVRQRRRLHRQQQPGRTAGVLLVIIWALVLGLWAWQAVRVGNTLNRYQQARRLLETGRVDRALSNLHGHARAELLAAHIQASRRDWAALDQHLTQALALASPADRATVSRAAVQLGMAAWEATGDRQWLTQIDHWVDQMLRYDPFSTEAQVLAGDAHWQAGRYDQAARRYRDALELDRLAYLDRLSLMSQTERDRLARRIAEADAESLNTPTPRPPRP